VHLIRRALAHARIPAAVLVGALLVRTVAADDCSNALITYSTVRLRILSACERRRERQGSSVNCRPDAGQVTDPSTRRRLRGAAANLKRTLSEVCRTLPSHAGPPCAALRTVEELTACVVEPAVNDVHAVTVDGLVDVLYGKGLPIGDHRRRRCRNRVVADASAYFLSRAAALQLCRDGEQLGAPRCPDAAAIDASAAARAAMEQHVREICTDEQAAEIDLGGACANFLLTSFERIAVPGNPNDNAILPLDALIRCVASATATAVDRVLNIAQPGPLPRGFIAGVAAGDVTDTSAILWTRLPDSTRDGVVELTTDPSFLTEVTRSHVVALPGEDSTVRVEMTLPDPNATYYYRFQQADLTSEIGYITRPSTMGRPLLDQPDVFLWAAGTDGLLRPFSVLDPLRVGRIDAFLYAGDTIFADDARGDNVIATSFDDFAGKYRANRVDSALRNLMESTVTFAIPDDREIRPHAAGAEPGFAALTATGLHAFRSYFPIRTDAGDPARLYRSVSWGPLVDLFLLDGRQYRTAELICCADGSTDAITAEGRGTCGDVGPMLQPDAACLAALSAPGRTVLGAAQKVWLKEALLRSTAPVKLVVGGPAMTEGQLLPYDRWEDYPAERQELLDYVRDNRIAAVWLGSGGVFVSTPGVDAAHRVPAASVGPIAAPPWLRTLPSAATALVPSLPALFPLVTRFEIDRPSAALITVSDVGFVAVNIDYFDEAGQKISSVTIRSAA
jgi:phosphodiesterase/alkaline phosphatase D-like protein